jgi:hypothetical protein
MEILLDELNLSYAAIEDFVSDYSSEITELFETGHCQVKINNKTFQLYLKVKED